MLIPGILVIIGLLYFFFSQESSTTPQVELINSQMSEQQEKLNTEKVTSEPVEQKSTAIMVDVKGAVKKPGVYQLSADSRVMDAITVAGGYLEKADSRLINHAQKLVDEMVIYIPLKGEVMEQEVMQSLVTAPAQVQGSSSSDSSGKVNLNTADEAALMTLPGIGPAKAKAILDYRQQNGSFKVIEDLKSVTGIGDKTFERLADLITVN